MISYFKFLKISQLIRENEVHRLLRTQQKFLSLCKTQWMKIYSKSQNISFFCLNFGFPAHRRSELRYSSLAKKGVRKLFFLKASK